ncbi:class I SAM-dependent methyltransferase [Paracoccus aestuariivivens]|uniref:Methyltransferase domain-containing protein n=1 Tax=Paracoccus aestuariivivens TaxID=1820333 RepID=A0A6L6JF33_9RHOB|nr:class I SAM-dependent methyltransferase [Paracoccus aestuariivivens]MTH79865.1 methyltransferase domain-containing protein [Paracoccus aestuariivivens]
MTIEAKISLPQAMFNREMAYNYDRKNSGLAPITNSLHFLARLVLEGLPPRSKILCVGVGTGAEILTLAEAFPQWTFLGIDPSAEMLEVCRERLRHAGILDRCELIQGYVHDAPPDATFDAALSLLVAHFIPRDQRADFYRAIHERLKPDGYFIAAELCTDLNSPDFPSLLKGWERIQLRMGANEEALARLPDILRNTLAVLSPEETDGLLRSSGFDMPVAFFQAFLIRGVFAVKQS